MHSGDRVPRGEGVRVAQESQRANVDIRSSSKSSKHISLEPPKRVNDTLLRLVRGGIRRV